MKLLCVPTLSLCLALTLTARAQEAAPTPVALFSAAVKQLTALVEPAAGAPELCFTATLKLTKAHGAPDVLIGRELDLAFQAPDRLRLSADVNGTRASLGRDGQELWAYVPTKKFGVIGQPGLVKFATAPDKKDTSKLGPFKLPLPRDQMAILPLIFKVEARPDEKVGNVECHAIVARPEPQALEAFKLQPFTLSLWLRKSDQLPARIGYNDGKKLDLTLEVQDAKLGEARPAA